MNQPGGNDGPRKDSNNGPHYWDYVLIVLLFVIVVVLLVGLYAMSPQFSPIFQNISNDM